MQTIRYEIREKEIYRITEQLLDPEKNPQDAIEYAKWSGDNPPRTGGRPKQPKDKK